MRLKRDKAFTGLILIFILMLTVVFGHPTSKLQALDSRERNSHFIIADSLKDYILDDDSTHIWVHKKANGLRIHYDSHTYVPDDFDNIITKIYNNIMLDTNVLISFSDDYFTKLSTNDTYLIDIFNRIDSIGFDVDSYKSANAKSIIETITTINEDDKKIYSLLYFEEHFYDQLKKNDTLREYYEYSLYSLYNNMERRQNDSSSVRCQLIYGDYYFYHNDLNNAFNLYNDALFSAISNSMYYEAGVAYDKIASLYIDFDYDDTRYISDFYQKSSEYIDLSIDWDFDEFTSNYQKAKLADIVSKKERLAAIENTTMKKKYRIDKEAVFFHGDLKRDFSNFEGKEFEGKESMNCYYLFRSLGGFCLSENYPKDLHAANIYYKAAVFFCDTISDIYELKDFLNALDCIAYSYSLLGNKKMAIKYSDMSINMAERFGIKQFIKYFSFQKANNLRLLGDFSNAFKSIKNGLKFDSDILLTGHGNLILSNIYNDLFQITHLKLFEKRANIYHAVYLSNYTETEYNLWWLEYSKQRFTEYIIDTLNTHKDKIQAQINQEIKNINVLNSTVLMLQEKNLNTLFMLDEEEKKLQQKKRELFYTIKELEYKNIKLIQNEFKLNSLNDTLEAKLIAADTANAQAYRSNIKRNIAIIERDSAIYKRNLAWSIGIGAFLFSVLFSWLYFRKKKNDFDKYRYKKEGEVQESNVRAAISQLFARTDSHDLGHVLDAYKSIDDFGTAEFENQYKAQGDVLLTETNLDSESRPIIRTDRLSASYAAHIINKENPSQAADLRFKFYPNLIAYFNQYLKTRMDFRADVATGNANSLTTLDYYNDIFIPFDNNLIFNNRISGISDPDLSYRIENSYSYSKERTLANKDISLQVAIPNDVLGCQALYIIWSNVIRNTVKHSKMSLLEKKDLILNIQLQEYSLNPDFIELSIFTSIYRDDQETESLVEKRNRAFDDAIFDKIDPNRMRDNNLGSIEMAACAAYARLLNVTDINKEKFKLFNSEGEFNNSPRGSKNEPVIIYAYSSKDGANEGKSSLGYKLYLLKPKEILVVCNDPASLGNNLIEGKTAPILQKFGIEFIEASAIKAKTYNHRFLVFAGHENDFEQFNNVCDDEELSASLPKRKLFIENPKYSDIPQFKNACWQKWIDKHNGQYLIRDIDNGNDYKYPKDATAFTNEIRLYDHHTNLPVGNLSNGDYHEMCCGHHWLKLYRSQLDKPFYLLPYIEGVITKVLIIDERIQKSIVEHKKKYADVIPYDNYFLQQGIIIPGTNNIGPNLNVGNLKEKKQELKEYITGFINKVEFVVLHLGLLEKFFNDNDVKGVVKLDELINELIGGENNRRKVVITTGRGKAVNVNPDLSFLPISLLQNAIETAFDKYRLVQILYNSRKSV
jgi:hypothetical protein